MIEELGKAAGRSVSRETFELLERYVSLLRDENSRQNLVSAATMDDVWTRHILDSAQLLKFEPHNRASWVDLGSGAGLPGVVIACLADGPVTLIEPRRLRADFLHRVVDELRLESTVICARMEKVAGVYDVITARAVSALPRLFEISLHLSTGKTVWVLPKGRTAASELADAKRTWQGVFHVERSVTDPEAYIVVGKGVRAKAS